MRRLVRLVVVYAVIVLGLVGLNRSGMTRAQEGTPAANAMAPAGVSIALLGVAQGVTLPSPADLQVAREEFAPGAGFAFDPSNPNGAMVVVETGALTMRVDEQDWVISRGAALQQASATPGAEPDRAGVLEVVPMGQAGTLQAGDAAYIPGNLTGDVRNTGPEPTSVLVFLIGPQGKMTIGPGGTMPAPAAPVAGTPRSEA